MNLSLSIEPTQFWDFPANVFIKDLHGVCIWANKALLNAYKLSHLEEYIGKTDFHFSRESEAKTLGQNDQMVINNNTPGYFDEPFTSINTIIRYKSYKMPVYDKSRNIVGIFGVALSIDLQCNGFSDLLFEFLNTTSISCAYKNMGIENLTDKEMLCIQMTAMGKTAKEIGKFLGRSHRTVEDHISSVKNKTGCFTKSELINLYWSYLGNFRYCL